MRRKTLAAVAVLGAVTVGAGSVLAQQASRPSRVDREALQAEIGLTDEQAASIRKLRLQERKAEVSLRADMQIARMELDELLGAATLDEAAIAAHTKTLASLQSAAAKARVDNQVAVRRLVSPEQYQKMQQMRMRFRTERAGRSRGWRHSGYRGGPPEGSEPESKPAPTNPASTNP